MSYPKNRKSVSPQEKMKISIRMIGNKHGSSNKGKKRTLESRLKISLKMRGEKNWNWQGGITKKNTAIRNSFEYKVWRQKVYKRDNYTCVWCGNKKERLEADHIKMLSKYPQFAFRVSNGRTLCKICHHKRTRRQLVKTKSSFQRRAEYLQGRSNSSVSL